MRVKTKRFWSKDAAEKFRAYIKSKLYIYEDRTTLIDDFTNGLRAPYVVAWVERDAK